MRAAVLCWGGCSDILKFTKIVSLIQYSKSNYYSVFGTKTHDFYSNRPVSSSTGRFAITSKHGDRLS